MHRITQSLVMALCMGVAVGSLPAQTAQPDNTRVNKRDRNKSAVTADQQKENKSDREIAKEIRQAVVGDKDLSTYAHNVKIVAQKGMVTLKGPVHTQEEKK